MLRTGRSWPSEQGRISCVPKAALNPEVIASLPRTDAFYLLAARKPTAGPNAIPHVASRSPGLSNHDSEGQLAPNS